MRALEYRVQYTGVEKDDASPDCEIVFVRARDLNSGFVKALKLARAPLGNGVEREIGAIEFWRAI